MGSLHTVQFAADFRTALEIQEAILGKNFDGYEFKIKDGGGRNTMMLQIIASNGDYEPSSAEQAFSSLLETVGKSYGEVNPIFVSSDDLLTKLGREL
jgi:hypothetical protein